MQNVLAPIEFAEYWSDEEKCTKVEPTDPSVRAFYAKIVFSPHTPTAKTGTYHFELYDYAAASYGRSKYIYETKKEGIDAAKLALEPLCTPYADYAYRTPGPNSNLPAYIGTLGGLIERITDRFNANTPQIKEVRDLHNWIIQQPIPTLPQYAKVIAGVVKNIHYFPRDKQVDAWAWVQNCTYSMKNDHRLPPPEKWFLVSISESGMLHYISPEKSKDGCESYVEATLAKNANYFSSREAATEFAHRNKISHYGVTQETK